MASDNFFDKSINVLPHGDSLKVIDKVLFYSKSGHVLCSAKPFFPKSMIHTLPNGESAVSSSVAIEYIAQTSAIGRIIEKRLANEDFKAFGAVMKVSSLKKITQNIGLDTPLLIYAEFKRMLPNVYEVSGSIRDANTNKDLATASLNIIEFDK